jgi:hypothetical protein
MFLYRSQAQHLASGRRYHRKLHRCAWGQGDTSATDGGVFRSSVVCRYGGGIEFKRDGHTGQFLMIEPTVGRIDGQEEVATLHGANIPLAAYLHEIGSQSRLHVGDSSPVIWRDFFCTTYQSAAIARGSRSPVPESTMLIGAAMIRYHRSSTFWTDRWNFWAENSILTAYVKVGYREVTRQLKLADFAGVALQEWP